jgi:hypothetical protein
VWEGVGAQRKRPHKPNHSGGPHAEVTPAGLMRLRAGMATRGSVLGQRYGITHALKLVAKCKAWCGCMSSTGEMKTRTAPAQIVQPLACWPERLAERLVCVSIVHLRCCPPQTPNGCSITVRGPAELAELALEPRCREGRRGGEASSGGEEQRLGVAWKALCVPFDDRGLLAAELPSNPPTSHVFSRASRQG